jgi:hypothetical protein
VELPGIELAAEVGVTCRYIDEHDAKARETTYGDLRIRQRC